MDIEREIQRIISSGLDPVDVAVALGLFYDSLSLAGRAQMLALLHYPWVAPLLPAVSTALWLGIAVGAGYAVGRAVRVGYQSVVPPTGQRAARGVVSALIRRSYR